MSKVIKRDGTTQQFSHQAVLNAILKAQEEVGMSSFAVASIIADKISLFVSEGDRTVDEIQVVVEMQLKEHQPEVGRAYHSYRVKRDSVRESNSPMFKDIANL
ncbi:MAG: ATP cone domain-containing protein, partial [Bacteroidales bacterium]